MTAPDTHDLKLRWIDALHDAHPDKQMRGYLTHGDHHCAVGIAAATLHTELGVHEHDTCFTDVEEPWCQVTSAELACRLALLLDVDRRIIGDVMNRNDNEGESFTEIADRLKEVIL